MEIAIRELERQDKYKLLIGCIIPRPIAWVTSHDDKGVVNAAPFSYFNVASIEPMMVSVAVMRKPAASEKIRREIFCRQANLSSIWWTSTMSMRSTRPRQTIRQT